MSVQSLYRQERGIISIIYERYCFIFNYILKNDLLLLLVLTFFIVITACKGSAKLMYTGTLALGCKAFQDAQNQACKCVGMKEEL